MGELPCYVFLLTTLTPRCLISSFIVQKCTSRTTDNLQAPRMKTVLVNEEHTQSPTLLTSHGLLPSILCLKIAVPLHLLLSSSTFGRACLVPKQGQRYFRGSERFYQPGTVSCN